MRKMMLTLVATIIAIGLRADIEVSDVEVFSGYPWKEVVIGYTIAGEDDAADYIRLKVTDLSIGKIWEAKALQGAKLIAGRHVMKWNAAAEEAMFSSRNVTFMVSIEHCGGVQLWDNGPYWAECNVGAASPEEYGYYFWWGGTTGYVRNSRGGWVEAKDTLRYHFLRADGASTYGKPNTLLQSEGYIDSAGNLNASHDAATVHLGTPWRIPTGEEFKALLSKCDSIWTVQNGVPGRLVKGRGTYATKSIFLPAAGYGECYRFDPWDNSCDCWDRNSVGYYWSSTPKSDDFYALGLFFNSTVIRCNEEYKRGVGLCIRPVRGASE